MSPEEIRKARVVILGLTQTKFGELLHAKMRTVQDWESGKRNMTPATQDLLQRIIANQQSADAAR